MNDATIDLVIDKDDPNAQLSADDAKPLPVMGIVAFVTTNGTISMQVPSGILPSR